VSSAGFPAAGSRPAARSGLKTALVVGGLVLVLCCGGVAVGVFALYRAAGGPEAAASQWLEGVRGRDFAASYDLLCAARRETTTPAEFRGMFGGAQALDSYEIRRLGTTTDARSEVHVRITLANGRGPRDGTLLLVKESGGWKVCDTIGFG
jgi:hypothetical protein